MGQHSRLDEVSRRYARALFASAAAQKIQNEVEQQMQSLQSFINEREELNQFLQNPLIKKGEQKKVMGALLQKSSYHVIVQNFIKLVVDKGRLNRLTAIIDAFQLEMAEMRGEKTAYITSASALSKANQDDVIKQLQTTLGKIDCQFTVDANLIGGMVIRVGSLMFDSSYKSHLQQLSSQMKGV